MPDIEVVPVLRTLGFADASDDPRAAGYIAWSLLDWFTPDARGLVTTSLKFQPYPCPARRGS
jgi:hypothetical protein